MRTGRPRGKHRRAGMGSRLSSSLLIGNMSGRIAECLAKIGKKPSLPKKKICIVLDFEQHGFDVSWYFMLTLKFVWENM
jgi:hypothetical protein